MITSKILRIIPARGGSKRIPGKNIKFINGKPLIQFTIDAAKKSKLISRIIISTDCDMIAKFSKKKSVEVINRPKILSRDTSSSESVLIHLLNYLKDKESYIPDLVVFLQCTSPIRKKGDIDKAIDKFLKLKADSCFSSCISYSLFWRKNKAGLMSYNYDYHHRKREQDREPDLIENGSLYIFNARGFLKSKNRLFGNIITFDMDLYSSIQIDTIEDFNFCSQVMTFLKDKKNEYEL